MVTHHFPESQDFIDISRLNLLRVNKTLSRNLVSCFPSPVERSTSLHVSRWPVCTFSETLKTHNFTVVHVKSILLLFVVQDNVISQSHIVKP